jgi:putative transposase
MSDNRRIADDALYCHFITFSCDRRRRLLDLDQPKRILLGHLNAQMDRQSAKCVGFVVMPDHVHAIIWFPETGQLRRFIQSWKRLSSHDIRKWYREFEPEYFRKENIDFGDRFWTPKYYAFEIYAREKLVEKLNYMHLNPVRAGLVENAMDYKWSTARWYGERRTVGVPIEWVE